MLFSGVYSWFTPCNTDSIAVGTVQCYQHSVCNNCILSLQLHNCWISEAEHSGRDRLLGIVISQELTASVFSVIVCGKVVHLLLLSDDLAISTSLHTWGGCGFDCFTTMKKTTRRGKGRLSDKIITACLNTLTHCHVDRHSLRCRMSIAEHLWPVGYRRKAQNPHRNSEVLTKRSRIPSCVDNTSVTT